MTSKIGTPKAKGKGPTAIDVDSGAGIRYDTETPAGGNPNKDDAQKNDPKPESVAPKTEDTQKIDTIPENEQAADADSQSKTDTADASKRSRRKSSTSGRRRSRRYSARTSNAGQNLRSGDVNTLMQISSIQEPTTSRRKGSTVKTELSDFDDVMETLTHQTSLRLPNNAFVKIRTHVDRSSQQTTENTEEVVEEGEARSVVSVSMIDTEYVIEVTRDRISCTKRCIQCNK